MKLTSREAAGVLVVTVDAPRIDARAAIRFKDEMRGLTGSWQGRVVLDLAAVEFVDSSGLGAIVGAMKQLQPPARLELAALSPAVAKVFALTRMDTVFAVHDDVAAALALPAGAG